MEHKVITKEKSKIKLKEPKKYSVIMENDDFTTMEFVIDVLMSVFNKDSIEANTAGRVTPRPATTPKRSTWCDVVVSQRPLVAEVGQRGDPGDVAG